MSGTDADELVTAAIAGDEPAFAALAERHRRELHVHCYRMLASFDEAEDAVQETLLKPGAAGPASRAARSSAPGCTGSPPTSAWTCCDATRGGPTGTLVRRGAVAPALPGPAAGPAAPSDEQPEAVAIQRETISLAFLAALQVLPPRQRAALIARDVLGWPASETASALGTSVAAANSALQRARATMQSHLPRPARRMVRAGADARRTRAAPAVHRGARAPGR